MNDSLPALEGTTISKTLGKHLNAMHAGRKAFIMAESSEKIRRALRHQIRPTSTVFTTGELVYFKRDNQAEWKGPGTVIGQDGKTVMINYSGYVVRVHVSRVIEINHENDINVDIENGKKNVLKEVKNISSSLAKSVDDDCRNALSDTMHSFESDFDDEVSHSMGNETKTVSSESNAQNALPVTGAGNIPKVGQKVKYLAADSDDWKTTTVLSRAGKATGKYKTWLNIQDEGCDP